MKEWFTTKELLNAPLLPQSLSAIARKANLNNWQKRKPDGVKGRAFEYHISSLPIETQAYLKAEQMKTPSTPAEHQMQAIVKADLEKESQGTVKTKAEATQKFLSLSEDKQAKAYAREAVLQAYLQFVEPYKLAKNKTEGNRLFTDAFNRGELLSKSKVREHVIRVSYGQLQRWLNAYEKEGVFALADKYKAVTTSKVDEQPRLADFIHALITAKPHFLKQPKSVHELAQVKAAEFGWELPSISSFKRWLISYAKKREVELAYITDPTAYTDKHRPLYARAYPKIDGPNQIWEFDSTPTDVELNVNGKLKRYSIVAAIDVWTRRVQLIVSPTSDSTAICLLLRKCLLEWGLPEPGAIMRTDNGSDYVSHRTTTIFSLLDLQISKAAAFSGWEKPFIERFFRTMSGTLMEKMVGYIGHSVSDRQQIEAMHTFAKRIGKGKKQVEQERLQLALTPEQLQRVFDEYLQFDYMHVKHDKDDISPFERYAQANYKKREIEYPHTLDMLLHYVGQATVVRGSVKVDGAQYTAHELMETAWQRKKVNVFLDPMDIGRATLYPVDSYEQYVEAIDMDLVNRGISPAKYKAKRKAEQKLLAQQRRIAKKLQEEFGVSNLYAEQLEQKKAEHASLTHFERTTTHNNAAIAGLSEASYQKQNAVSEHELEASDHQSQAVAQRRENQAHQESRIVRNAHEKAVMLTKDSLIRELTEKEAVWLKKYRLNNQFQRKRLDKILESAEQSTNRQVK
ncbi:MAG: DNA-binding protein [Parashewanella sp.]